MRALAYMGGLLLLVAGAEQILGLPGIGWIGEGLSDRVFGALVYVGLALLVVAGAVRTISKVWDRDVDAVVLGIFGTLLLIVAGIYRVYGPFRTAQPGWTLHDYAIFGLLSVAIASLVVGAWLWAMRGLRGRRDTMRGQEMDRVR